MVGSLLPLDLITELMQSGLRVSELPTHPLQIAARRPLAIALALTQRFARSASVDAIPRIIRGALPAVDPVLAEVPPAPSTAPLAIISLPMAAPHIIRGHGGFGANRYPGYCRIDNTTLGCT